MEDERKPCPLCDALRAERDALKAKWDAVPWEELGAAIQDTANMTPTWKKQAHDMWDKLLAWMAENGHPVERL